MFFSGKSGINSKSMSMIDSIAHTIKGFALGALAGLVLPVAWMTVVFGGPTFIKQFSDGRAITVILTSIISIPFSIMFQGLFGGGLLTLVIFGAASGVVIAIITLIVRPIMPKQTTAILCAVLALIAAVMLVLTQSSEITLSTGLVGTQVWVLASLFILFAGWLGYKMRDVYIA